MLVPASRLEVIPVVHARSGELVGPDAEPLDEDLRTVSRRFSREHDALYLVDLDGIRRNRPDVALLQEVGGRVHTWADAGSRSPQDVMDLIIAGAEQVTVRYETADGVETIEEAVRLSENVALGLEFRDGSLVPNDRWPATLPELIDLAERLNLPIVAIDLDRAGTAKGVNRSVAWHARHHDPGGYFAGGVSGQRDLDVLDDLGYQGALVSTALLEGTRFDAETWSGPVGHRGEDEADTDTDVGSPGGFSPTEGIL